MRHAWTYVSVWAVYVGGLAVFKVEVLRIEVEQWHVAQMTLMLWPQVQASRRARHDREARCRRRDIPPRRDGPVRDVAITAARARLRDPAGPVQPREDHRGGAGGGGAGVRRAGERAGGVVVVHEH